MKKTFKFILILLCFALGLLAINNETDFFRNIGGYIPALEENHPEAAKRISNLSNDISAIAHQIPSFRELVAIISGKEMPIDPSDVASNAYTKDSPMLTFYPSENISMRIADADMLEIFGVTASIDKSNLAVCFDTPDGETLSQVSVPTDSSYEFYETLKIPETDSDTLTVNIYTGSHPYGNFTSWVYNYAYISKNVYGAWEIARSPVHEHNVSMYEKDKSLSDALKSTLSIQSEYANMKSIAAQLTEGCATDYERAAAIHDWVASYLYYDVDSIASGDTAPYSAAEVVNGRRAVCLGYATLYATLCRSIGIPCSVVSGYALGVASGATKWTDDNIGTDEQNHAWNEVYIDGRWIIVDTTWDSQNKYENGEFIDGGEISHLYFDANLEFFSSNHKILEYPTRR